MGLVKSQKEDTKRLKTICAAASLAPLYEKWQEIFSQGFSEWGRGSAETGADPAQFHVQDPHPKFFFTNISSQISLGREGSDEVSSPPGPAGPKKESRVEKAAREFEQHADQSKTNKVGLKISLKTKSAINSKGSVMLSTRCKGLWRECVWDRFVKIWTCDVFSSYLNPHPATIVLTRTLIITSSILSVSGFLLLICAVKNINCCQDANSKRLCLRLSFAMYVLTGMSSSAAIIRYCIYVYHLHQYEVSLKIPGFPSYEYGYSLWMAIGGDLTGIATAIITGYLSLYKKKHNSNKETTEEGHPRGLDVLKTYV
ncbi:claudin-16-like [Hyperolius riggenbachi]|uniref:claudin-16-like n=1 Tax=Hyperolius riggenbachi TaxID=752182 RepID=UPI0035A35FC4